MPYDVIATFIEEQVKLEGTHPIEMYVLNASYSGTDFRYYVNNNQDVYGYVLNASGEVGATEQLYTGLPLTRDDVQTNTTAEIGELNVSLPNVDRIMESLIQNNNYLRGNEVIVVTTFAKFLPSGSAAEYIGVTPDYRSHVQEKYYIDSVTSNETQVTFSCRSKFNIRKIILPSRKFTHECAWDYNSVECSPQFSSDTSATYPTCNYTVENCRQRHNQERFGGWLGIPRDAIFMIT